METTLHAISPLDGRYADISAPLKSYFSDYALFNFRILIEVRYLLHLSEISIAPKLSAEEKRTLLTLVTDFSEQDAVHIKEIEKKINHDIKAIELFIREKIKTTTLEKLSPFIHLGLTSEDISNLSGALQLSASLKTVILPQLKNLHRSISEKARDLSDAVIMGRTHGQAAIPTTLGKECANYADRIQKQIQHLESFTFEGKINGAVGCYNPLVFVFPETDWLSFSTSYIKGLGLAPNLYSTQILPYDNWIEYFNVLTVTSGILLDIARDFWLYALLDLISLKNDEGFVGSSTMPQKINPIYFENAEGNLEIAISFFQMFSRTLLHSRLQRDLSDSTIRRSFGTALGHVLLATHNLNKGLQRTDYNKMKAENELDNHWEILSEAIQIFMRAKGNDNAYEIIKQLVQGKTMNKSAFHHMIAQLPLSPADKNQLKRLSPLTYIGLAKHLALHINNDAKPVRL